MRKAAIGNTNIVKNLYGIGRLPLVLDARQTVEAREQLVSLVDSRSSRPLFTQASRSNVISTASGSLSPACDNAVAVIRVYSTCNETQWTTGQAFYRLPVTTVPLPLHHPPPRGTCHFCGTWPVSNLSGYIDADDLSGQLGEHRGKNEINEPRLLWFIVKYCAVE